jgi:hypothetical protein
MKKKDEPTLRGTWKGGKKAAERQRHAQSVAAAARAGQKIRNKIPASPGDKSSGNESVDNSIIGKVLKESYKPASLSTAREIIESHKKPQ